MLIIILLLLLILLFNRSPFLSLTNKFIKSYSDLLKDNFDYTPGGIPKIIIKTSWQSRNEMPKQMIDALNKTNVLNPDYQLYYFDNTDVIEFMKDYSPRAFAAYNKIIPGAFKADLFRICVLEKYGGCYSDIGHVPENNITFNEICGDVNIVLVLDNRITILPNSEIPHEYTGVHNALMCSTKNHGFFKLLVDKTCENIENGYYGNGPLDVTGPMMIGKQFNCYFADICDYINKNIMNYGYTDYNCDNCKIKILKLALLPPATLFILDSNNKKLIKTKFDDYFNIMYTSKKQKHYGELWALKQIYN